MLDLSCGGAKIDSALFLGAHSDDIETGCGGTILRLVAARPHACIHREPLSIPGPQGLARLRGIECNAPEGFAEAFYAREFVV